MIPGVYRFEFDETVSMESVESSMAVALFAAEGLCSPALIRLGFGYAIDAQQRTLVADARTEAGQVVTRIFTVRSALRPGDPGTRRSAYAAGRREP
jgi:hypothetical protein